MARTEPHHDWQDDKAASKAAAEWESLRNELVALLDQVEDQIGAADPAGTGMGTPSQPRAAAPSPDAPAPAAPSRPEGHSRHDRALRSVRLAVDRLAERRTPDDALSDNAPPETPPSKTAEHNDSVTAAINQIRARQGRQPQAAPQAAPQDGARDLPPRTPHSPKAAPAASELAGFAQAVGQLGERITQFETAISGRLDTLGRPEDVSEQIAQLSDVIEMLANAVGESGQVKRLETQIAHLADEVTKAHTQGPDAIAAQIEALAESIDKLATHQVQNAGRDAQAEARQADSMRLIEESVLSIYERIDALEQARPDSSADFERISRELAGLAAAIENDTDFDVIARKIDALGERITSLESAPHGSASDMGMVRDAVSDAVAPRFSALETRIDDLGARLDGGAAAPQDLTEIEAQLRKLSQRVEETGAELKTLAGLYQAEETGAGGIDIDALAQAIAAHSATQAPAAPDDGIARADLEALETRLSRLLTRESEAPAKSSEPLSGVKDSIAQVDNRLARLESLLNGKQQAAPAPQAEAAPKPRTRRAADDTMPADPTSGAPRKSRPAEAPRAAAAQAPIAEAVSDPVPEPERDRKDAPKAGPTFMIDPAAVKRPAKPQSRLASDTPASGFSGPAPSSDADVAPEPRNPGVNRANFIEAARRSARQHAPEEPETGAKSLIGRALSRFQRTQNAPDEDQIAAPQAKPQQAKAAETETPEPKAPKKGLFAFKSKASQPAEPVEPERAAFGGVDDAVAPQAKRPGFIARNKRPLLLATALVVVLALAAQLVISRSQGERAAAPAPQEPAQSAPAQTPGTETPATETSAPDETSSSAEPPVSGASEGEDVLTSQIRMIDQSPALSSGTSDFASMMADMGIDDTETAAIPPNSDRYAAGTDTLTTAPITQTNLPATTVPESIEPAGLRDAAQDGNMRAQFEIGAILTEGHVVEQDLAAAAAWYERSASQGFAPAQYRLGNLYENGQGVEKDLELARLWYQRAAEAGNRMSMHNLASLYAGGALDEQNFGAAARWFEEAAARGLTDSQFNLGMLYARGLGVEQSFENSYIWFSLAAESGDADAETARDDVARSLDADTVQRLNQTVAEWLPVEINIAANFAPIGTWDENFDPGQEIANTDVILRVQQLLDKLGYDIGTPDGIVGPKTREAIAAFEQATGMNESGQVNPRLLAVLGSQPV